MWNWRKTKSKRFLTRSDIEEIKALVSKASENIENIEREIVQNDGKEKVEPEGFKATNELKRDFNKDFEDYVNSAHQQMMRITIMKLETAERIDIEQLKMEQLKALRLKRIG